MAFAVWRPRLSPAKLNSYYLKWLLRAVTVEFVCTALFVFISSGSVVSTGFIAVQNRALSGTLDVARLLTISFAHGIGIVIMVAVASGVSGGHVNPAVTFSFVATGRMDMVTGFTYICSQLLGSVVGGGFLRAIFEKSFSLGAHRLGANVSPAKGVLVEACLTFILIFTVWGTSVDHRGPLAIAPLCIGLAVFVDMIFGVPLTGPSMNPARTFGTSVWSGIWDHHWVYWVGPGLGALIAGVVYNFVVLDVSNEFVGREGGNSPQPAVDPTNGKAPTDDVAVARAAEHMERGM